MKLIGIVSTAVLSLAIAAPVYAQQEQHDQEKNRKISPRKKKAQPEKSAKPEEKKRTAGEERQAGREECATAGEERQAGREESATTGEERQAGKRETPSSKIRRRTTSRNKEMRSSKAKPQEQHASGNGGGRIPDDRYKANFGQQHTFRVSQGDYNNHQFQYGGYSFAFVGAWPSNWLYTQNVYVIDIDGVYYLCNPMYPGVNIALDVNL